LAPAKASFKKENTDDGKYEIKITARTEKEARRMLEGLQKKHPNNNFQDILNGFRITSKPLEEPIHLEFSIGGPLAGRSIVKTAIAMASHMSISMDDCVSAIRYLVNLDADAVWAAFHLRDLIVNRPSAHLFHAVAVHGTAESGNLLGYIEYFGVFRHVVVLSQKYRGPDIKKCYAINPVTSEELRLEVDISLSESEIELLKRNETSPIEARIADLKLALPIVLQTQNFNGRNQLLNAAITETFEECGVKHGEEIPQERFSEFSAKLAAKAAAIFMHQRKMPST
jgi:hypothetical protein